MDNPRVREDFTRRDWILGDVLWQREQRGVLSHMPEGHTSGGEQLRGLPGLWTEIDRSHHAGGEASDYRECKHSRVQLRQDAAVHGNTRQL